jgi:hypothetical protein
MGNDTAYVTRLLSPFTAFKCGIVEVEAAQDQAAPTPGLAATTEPEQPAPRSLCNSHRSVYDRREQLELRDLPANTINDD